MSFRSDLFEAVTRNSGEFKATQLVKEKPFDETDLRPYHERGKEPSEAPSFGTALSSDGSTFNNVDNCLLRGYRLLGVLR